MYVCIIDSNGKPRMSLGLRFDDSPFVDLSDRSGRTRATFEITEDNAPALRMFDENLLNARVLRISKPPRFARSVGSTTKATPTSPKMKWLSRSRQFMCPVVSSGTTTSAQVELPQRSDSVAS